MKKVRIPFSLEEYNRGGYEVETRGDERHKSQKVRLICTDRTDNNYPIIALVKNDDSEVVRCFSKNGESICEEESISDLFLVKQEFEDGDIVSNGNKSLAIIKSVTSQNEFIPYIQLVGHSGNIAYYNTDSYDKIYLATEEEKQVPFDALEKEGKRWNTETKTVLYGKQIYLDIILIIEVNMKI